MTRGGLPVRLQKVLARAGIASRRAAEGLIVAGRVRVDGRVVTELGIRVDPRTSRVEVDGERIARESLVYIVLHKPRGAVSTMHDPEGRPTVRDLLTDAPGRVYPIGRLDFNTSGALFVTNDGDFAEGLMHPRLSVPKTYIVKVQGLMKPADLAVWRGGVTLEDGKTLPARVKLLREEGDKSWLELTITEGRNQQVRRMGDATGFRVMRLARAAFAGVSCEGLRPGAWRYLSADELSTLKKEYGVPKRVVSPPQPTERPPVAKPRAAPHHGNRSDASPPERPARHGNGPPGRPRAAPHHGNRSDASPPERPARHGSGPPGRPRTAPHHGNRSDASPPERTGRYGGGSPGRRPAETRDDWGGRIERGSSSTSDEGRAPQQRPGFGGRAGATRTTGTGGGIGAEGNSSSYRVRGRRG